MELHRLEYWDDEFERIDPLGTIGETVGDFAQRSFEIDGKTITGMEVVKLIKQYVADLHAESEAPVQ